MSLLLSLDKFDKLTNLVIYGYMREAQKILQKIISTYLIPLAIQCLVGNYHGSGDYFASTSPGVQIRDHGLIITKKEGDHETFDNKVYGRPLITSPATYIWTFRALSMESTSLRVGIAPDIEASCYYQLTHPLLPSVVPVFVIKLSVLSNGNKLEIIEDPMRRQRTFDGVVAANSRLILCSSGSLYIS